MHQEQSPDPAVELAHAMFQAAREGNLAGLGPVLDRGAPLDMQDSEGNTMLMLAAYHGHAGVVEDLGRRGADVERENDRGQTPLAGAVFKGHDDVVTTLLRLGADPERGTPTARATATMFGRTYFDTNSA